MERKKSKKTKTKKVTKFFHSFVSFSLVFLFPTRKNKEKYSIFRSTKYFSNISRIKRYLWREGGKWRKEKKRFAYLSGRIGADTKDGNYIFLHSYTLFFHFFFIFSFFPTLSHFLHPSSLSKWFTLSTLPPRRSNGCKRSGGRTNVDMKFGDVLLDSGY